MTSSNSTSSFASAVRSLYPLDFWVGLASGPLLVGLILHHNLQHWLETLGHNSEELFRGERLPILEFPEAPTASNSPNP